MTFHKLVLALAVSAFMWGCFPAPLIFAGAAGGAVYSTTNDTMTDTFVMSKEQAFEVMIGILNKEDAKINVSSIADGKIEAKTATSAIYVRIEPFNAESIKMSINAKKNIELIPDKDTAVRIYRLFIKETIK
ncbi:hypothetical protein [Seleniivibrio woodruffii]|uniref:DUF3568 family protein n=1 Tax=Seleniivibrio woodruffii TaxID=1078050 RepID=A0A4R1KA52_9BACT|nr:hypothetical protein [Seleniivibrio woodruffii]TCK60773.1 hypothetical protein C8D98_1652 [Seleniivibrio woodruffii]TVZ36403.1 hypothetical protein OF66_2028 [Seleniivibrio woodruffii]